MNFKYRIYIVLLLISVMFMSCSDDKPFSVAGPDDEPRILAPTFPDRNNGELSIISNINRDVDFSMERSEERCVGKEGRVGRTCRVGRCSE